MDSLRRSFLAAATSFGATVAALSTAESDACGRRRRRYACPPICPPVTPGNPVIPNLPLNTIDRGLDAAGGRPGSSNRGQSVLRVQDRRPAGRRALSLHMGVNWNDPTHYGRIRQLNACLYDAQRMQQLAQSYGFVTSMLTNTYATAKTFHDYLARQADELVDGDMLFVTFAGHGSNIDDGNGDEKGGMDETWCLFDRMLIDDELWFALSRFAPGVRILVVLDSCHSGTAFRMMQAVRSLRAEGRGRSSRAYAGYAASMAPAFSALEDEETEVYPDGDGLTLQQLQQMQTPVARTLRTAEAAEIYIKNEDLYRGIQEKTPNPDDLVLDASALLLAACQDGQYAKEIGSSGLFTTHLVRLLQPLAASGQLFAGSYDDLLVAVKQRMGNNRAQTPELFTEGELSTIFRNERPFDLAQQYPPQFA